MSPTAFAVVSRRPARPAASRRPGFSLIELVIVVVIIGIIAAIAIPRMSRGSAGAADSALASNLSILRNAVDIYQTEHNGLFPTAAGFTDQLTKFSNAEGTVTSATKNTATGVIYGPYLRRVPTLSVGPEKGLSTVGSSAAAGTAWVYTETTGEMKPNMPAGALDSAGKAYADY